MTTRESGETQHQQVVLVWAQAKNGAIGRDGTMPWHLPEDLAHFKRSTLGAPVIMGRRTWESLPESVRPLPGRNNVVITRNPEYAAAGATLAADLNEALACVRAAERVCVIGGGQLYRAAMPQATELVVTQIETEVTDADTFAPEIGPEWQLAAETEREISRTGLPYRFQRYVRQIA